MINACEAMEQGGSIVIQEEEALAPTLGRAAVIRLKDNGPGIPESIRDDIFHPFFSTKEEGTGLGLSIAARIIEEHQGRLDVQSKQGQGSAFIITLPIKE
jgi:signal transduction histidine kinase